MVVDKLIWIDADRKREKFEGPFILLLV
jgi:hypothetical protein